MKPTKEQIKTLQQLKVASNPHQPGAQDVAAMDARNARLALLYEISGRTSMNYTGLHIEADALGF